VSWNSAHFFSPDRLHFSSTKVVRARCRSCARVHSDVVDVRSDIVAPDDFAMAATIEYVKLAQSLPPRLLRFFARYPPSILSSTSTQGQATTALNTFSQDSNASQEEATVVDEPTRSPKPYNPFRAHKHSLTGVWQNSRFSLRQQADLVKLARHHGVEELLPHTPKKTDVRLRKREQLGLRVKGTGEGQKVKGKKEERTMKSRLDRRRQAILEMPAMIEKWKEVRYTVGTLIPSSDTAAGRSWARLEKVAEMSVWCSSLTTIYSAPPK